MFHISDCKKYNRCPILYLKDQENEKSEFQQFVRLDEQITQLAVQKLKLTDYFLGERNDPKERALEALNSYEWLVKARFEYKTLRVKVPFLHRIQNAYDLYFLFVGLYPLTTDMQFYCDTVWVLQNNQIEINNIYIIHLNASYERGKELDVEQLFTISDTFYNANKNTSISLKEAIYSHMTDLSSLLEKMENCSYETVLPPKRTNKCAGRNKCRYYSECFEEEKYSDNSIVTLSGSQYRFDMQKKGIEFLKDTDLNLIEGTKLQYAQIEADRNGGLFVDKLALSAWMKEIKYPITFLDFEWERFAIPPYEKMHPFDVMPFEYSIHIMHEDGAVEHKVFLSIHDDRRELANSLIHDIPKEGSVVAYNAFGAEYIRIEEMMYTFPELEEELKQINNRMVDLQLPFESGLVYDVRMRGLWSVKVIMSLMHDKSYDDLAIHQGMDAVYEWRRLDKNDEEADKEEIVNNLKAYCGMDSYAMMVIYKWLLQFIKNV